MQKISVCEDSFLSLWEHLYPTIRLERELCLIPNRRFRFDFAELASKTVIEINGGNWVRGRHVNPTQLIKEYEKINLIQLMGYSLFILTPEMITKQWVTRIAESIRQKY